MNTILSARRFCRKMSWFTIWLSSKKNKRGLRTTSETAEAQESPSTELPTSTTLSNTTKSVKEAEWMATPMEQKQQDDSSLLSAVPQSSPSTSSATTTQSIALQPLNKIGQPYIPRAKRPAILHATSTTNPTNHNTSQPKLSACSGDRARPNEDSLPLFFQAKQSFPSDVVSLGMNSSSSRDRRLYNFEDDNQWENFSFPFDPRQQDCLDRVDGSSRLGEIQTFGTRSRSR